MKIRLTKGDIHRFRKKYSRGTKKECWLWNGSIGTWGYGNFVLIIDGKYTTQKAHRVAYLIYYGKFPDKLALHTCDNPACVNPHHLYDGTSKQNAQDMVKRGRLRTHFQQGHQLGFTKSNPYRFKSGKLNPKYRGVR